MPVVSLKDIMRCWSKKPKSSICLNKALHTNCCRAPLNTCMPNKIFALSVLGPAVMVPGCGWGREQLGCNPTLPSQRKRKKAWHEHFGSSLFQREQNFVYCLLSFDFFHGCGSGLGFQIPVPAKQQARFCPQIPASNPLELQWFWSTHKLLPVYLITEGGCGS